jgi:cytochrome c oxidase assembly factor CtaG
VTEQLGALVIGWLLFWTGRFYWLYIIRPELHRNPLRLQSRIRHTVAWARRKAHYWIGLMKL